MGCISTKVAPMPTVVRVRNKKERKRLKKMLKSQGIKAKVTKSGVAFDVPIIADFQKPKLPPIKSQTGENKQLSKDGTERQQNIKQRIEEKQELAKQRRLKQQKTMQEKMKRQCLI